ncbi:MAG: hypothetical protein U0805_21790 [Pirellulales bacterium]
MRLWRIGIAGAWRPSVGVAAGKANEKIENLIVPWDEALAMIDRGVIRDGKTTVGLLLWERRRRTLWVMADRHCAGAWRPSVGLAAGEAVGYGG